MAEIARAGAEVAGSLGAESWVISGLSNSALFGALSKAQDYVANYFSDDVTVSAASPLSFSRPNGKTGLTFETGWATGAPSVFKIELNLGVVQSQVTERLRDSGAGVMRPDVINSQYAPPAGTWAGKIVVVPATGGAEAKRLSTVLAGSGVPRRLSDLGSVPNETGVTGADRVEAACRDLVAALEDDQYFRLNQIDADLILFDQLNQARVFVRYRADQIPCVDARVGRWKARYGLVLPDIEADIPFSNMEARLKIVARYWKAATVEARSSLIDSFQSPVSVNIPISLLPSISAALTETSAGQGSGQLNAAALSEAQLSCIGAWKKDGKLQAAMLVRFVGSEVLYAARIGFREVAGSGTLVSSLDIRAATDAERTAAGPAGSCVAP